MTQGLSRYQQFLMDTSPVADEYGIAKGIVQPKVNPTVIKNPNPSLQTILSRNIRATGKGISSGLKAAGGTTSKLAGRVAPGLGAGLAGYDAFRSYQIADEMEKINQIQPNSFPKEAIDFYRNKGRAITAGAGIGAGAGGVLGAGAFSIPGTLIGTGVGGGLAGLGYELAQMRNPYANYKISPEQYELLRKSNQGDSTNNSNNTVIPSSTNVVKGNGRVGNQPTTQQQALALAQQLSGNTPVVNHQDTDTQRANIQAINDYVSKLQEINQPYINSLQKYMDNYNDMLDQRQRAARFWQGAASLTGNPAWANIGRQYDVLTNEANKVAIIKQIQDAQAGDLNAINEIMGNLAMAEEMGLPPEAAFANKNLLTMMAARDREANRYQIALENNLMKKYGIDRNYARALTVQAMRNQNALDVASMYTGAYSNDGGVAPGLNRQGAPSNVPASYNVMLQAAHNKNNR